VLEDVRRIHDFVVDSLEYERDDRWDPADRVLGQKQGSCSEYAYLMIALCRLNGIPARYAGGTWIEAPGPDRESTRTEEAYVDRVFHRWVEVYLPRVGWFPVDPTRDDAAEKQGQPYLYFGSLPWSYLIMTHGDGDVLESGALGWEYRSSAQWRARQPISPSDVSMVRYAAWSQAEPRLTLASSDGGKDAAPRAAPAARTTEGIAGGSRS
jgi:transglutaminase-like putative cysteine protease